MTVTRSFHARTCLKLVVAVFALLLPWQLTGAGLKTTADQPPRKVIVGTVMQPFWVKHPGLEARLAELTAIVDRMQVQSQAKYGRGLDLAVLPETAVTGEGGGPDFSFPWGGPMKEAFVKTARRHHCYIVVPTYLMDDAATKKCSNAAILVGRQGELVGIYRKVHLVTNSKTGAMEHGATPGQDEPVFTCDFGKVGMQICYDMNFDYGWAELARRGAELVAWPTQSPQTSQPASRARRNRYYIVSSTWRNNASIFEPTGKITAQIRERQVPGDTGHQGIKPSQENVLVQEIDLSYAILPWSSPLENGKGLTAIYGGKVGYRYYEDEDCGMFWSNDSHTTIGQMFRKLGLMEEQEEFQRDQEIYRKAGVAGY
jgi:predicted amidohydrolase